MSRDMLVIFIAILVPVTALAAEAPRPLEAMTLGRAQELALLHNPELAARRWEQQALGAGEKQAGRLPNPEFELELENFGGGGPNSGFNAAETTLLLSQLVELGGKRSRRRELAAQETQLNSRDYKILTAELRAETGRAFVSVLAAQQRLSLNRELEHLAEQFLRTVTQRVQAGKVSPIEQTRTEVVLHTRRLDLERANADLAAARIRLASLWGSTDAAFEKAEGDLAVLPELPPVAVLMPRLDHNPELALWDQRLTGLQAVVELERARGVPDLTLSGGVKHLREIDEYGFVAGVSLPLPLFDRNTDSVEQARFRLTGAEQVARAQRLRLETAVKGSYQRLRADYQRAKTLETLVLPAAQSVFDAVSEGYRLGKFGYLVVLDSQQTLFESRVQYVEVLTELHHKLIDIERLIGGPLAGHGLPAESEEVNR